MQITDQRNRAANAEICEPIFNMEAIYQLSMFQETMFPSFLDY